MALGSFLPHGHLSSGIKLVKVPGPGVRSTKFRPSNRVRRRVANRTGARPGVFVVLRLGSTPAESDPPPRNRGLPGSQNTYFRAVLHLAHLRPRSEVWLDFFNDFARQDKSSLAA